MKRWIYNTGVLLSMLAFAACTDEVITPEPGPIAGTGEKEIPLMISMEDLSLSDASTYGTDYAGETLVGGTAWENAINDITVYIFNNSFECEKIIQATSSPTDPVMVKTGTKHFIAVVNAEGKINLPTTEAATEYLALQKMITNASLSLPTSPFLMTGKAMSVPLPDELPNANPYKISIDVERACAKVTLRVTKSGLSAAHNITLRKVTLYNGANRVALFTAPDPNPTTYSLTKTETIFNPVSGVVPNNGSGNYCMLDTALYTYESLCGTDSTKGVWIELESAVNSPSNIRTAKFYLGNYSSNGIDTTYDVKRNFWYNVTVDIVKPGMDSIDVTVIPSQWKVADEIPVTPGEGGQGVTSAPFKLVKYYTAEELSRDTSFAAIDSHSKGASWIDITVSYGTPWALKLKDGSPRNQGVIASIGGTNWVALNYDSPERAFTGIGTDQPQRVYIYRPYVENNEPDLGPTLYLEVNGTRIQDFIIQPREPAPVPTNSFILRPQLSGTPLNETRAYIPLADVYRYWEDYIYANGVSIPTGTILAEVLWKDNTGTVVKNMNVINAGQRESAYIYLEAGAVQGNSVVTMKVQNVDTIFWTFHIWVTEYNPYEAAGQKLYTNTRNVFMDRDLGAMSNVYDADGNARGLRYQFGRMAPFPRSVGWADFPLKMYNAIGGTMTTNTSNATDTATSLRPLFAIRNSINTPTTLYDMKMDNKWYISIENPYLWNSKAGNKTAFDPCPEGWRVPVQDNYGVSYSPWNGVTTTNLAEGLQSNGRYHSSLGYYPYNGYFRISSMHTGTEANYWSSWSDPEHLMMGTGLEITSSPLVNAAPTIIKSTGASIRCVVDKNYLINTEDGGLFGSQADRLKQEVVP